MRDALLIVRGNTTGRYVKTIPEIPPVNNTPRAVFSAYVATRLHLDSFTHVVPSIIYLPIAGLCEQQS